MCLYVRQRTFSMKSFFYPLAFACRVIELFKINNKRKIRMCSLRAGLVKNCRRCKSSVRLTCTARKKSAKKMFVDNKKKGETKK